MDKRLTKSKIISAIEEHRDELKKFGVKKIALFGSFAKDNQKKDSDIDILVTFNNTTFDNYMDLKFFLEDIFNRKVDLVIESDLKQSLSYVKEGAVYAEAI